MTQYVGLDVADEETSVCVVDQEGAVLVEAKVASEPAAIAAFIRARAPQAMKVGFETGPLAAWHWHELKQLGLPVVCLDARHAKAALACQINKTDRNDVFGLAQLVRMGWYREVQVKSYGSHYVRAALRVRALLVRSRCDFENQVRGLLKIFGLRLGKTGRKGFAKRMAELLEKQPELEALVAALLKVRETIVEQIATLDAGLQRIAKGSATIRRLMTLPGIGPITALAFASAIDDPFRFRKASSVGAYFGLTPRRGDGVIGSNERRRSIWPAGSEERPRQGGRCPRLRRLTALTRPRLATRFLPSTRRRGRRRQNGLEPSGTSDRAPLRAL